MSLTPIRHFHLFCGSRHWDGTWVYANLGAAVCSRWACLRRRAVWDAARS